MFPQDWQFNRGKGSEWRALEAEWLELAQEGKTVDVTIEVLYGDATTPNRPTGIGVTYEINGVVQPEKEFVNGR